MTKRPELYEYYEEVDILPTFGGLQTQEQFDNYVEQRRHLFVDLLKLPMRWFNGARILEYGPDSGENALVLAAHGAKVTLVEPNTKAVPQIKDYFAHWGMADSLEELVNTDVQSHAAEPKGYDMVVAEGFISHVRPEEIWINRFRDALKDDGLMLISINDNFGMIAEYLIKAIYDNCCAGKPEPLEIAYRIFEARWESIPHTRSFASWAMDLPQNPLLKKDRFFDTADLFRKLDAGGFQHHTSWPIYQDGAAMYWHKAPRDLDAELASQIEQIERSRLSYAFGRKMFMTGDKAQVDAINAGLDSLVDLLNEASDGVSADLIDRLDRCLSGVAEGMRAMPCLVNDTSDLDFAVSVMEGMRTMMKLILDQDLEGLVAHCNSNASFIGFWGQPHHFALFRKKPA